MGRLTLYALGITELRDIFGAEPGLAGRLRTTATSRYAAPTGARRGHRNLLERVGPVLKRPLDRPAAPPRPTIADAEALLAGRAIPEPRREWAWQILLAWLDDLSWGSVSLELTDKAMTDVEFALATAGLPSPVGLTQLLQDSPQIPLQSLPGQRFGYAKHAHVEATAQGLSRVIGDLPDETRPIVETVLEFLNSYRGWSLQAQTAGRPEPDLVAVWTGVRS